ncbi:MAG: transposase [Lachnospiraceae bacterium]|jgi:transposase-like protein|nr:transposase [Lachnospiraceae bacterium]
MNCLVKTSKDEFRNRALSSHRYPILWTDALYEDVRIDGHVISEAIIVACSVDEHRKRDVLAVEPMAEESLESYKSVFDGLKDRCLQTPKPIISDANKWLVSAVKQCFQGASWQRCKVYFMRNILAAYTSDAEENVRF